MFVLILIAVLAVAGLVAYLVWKAEQKRRAALASFAAAQGWQFAADDTWSLDERWAGTPFGSGHSRRAGNVLTGTAPGDFPMVAFDYEYKETSHDSKGGSTTSTYHFAVCALQLPCPMPGLHVGMENILTRIGSAVGMADIEFESDDFNRAFRVRCDDPRFASDVLHPRAMEMLLQHGRGIEWRFSDYDMLSWRKGRLEVPDLLARLHLMRRVIDGIPSFVWKDRGHDPGTRPQPQGGS